MCALQHRFCICATRQQVNITSAALLVWGQLAFGAANWKDFVDVCSHVQRVPHVSHACKLTLCGMYLQTY